MRYLSGEDILVIHAELIDATSGTHGVRDVGLFLHLAEKPKQSFGGKEVHPSIFEKAAVYFDAFARHQVFLDGNKRTAVAVTARFLFVNGFDLRAGSKALEVFTLSVAAKSVPIERIARWLKTHARRISS
jgi:death-on-curing protein